MTRKKDAKDSDLNNSADEKNANSSEKSGGESAKEQLPSGLPPLPKELEEKLKDIKDKIDKFKGKILEKFDSYIMGIALLPPEQTPKTDGAQGTQGSQSAPGQDAAKKQENDKKINLLILIDDSDVKKMTKYELRDKLVAIFDQTAKEIDERLKPDPLLLSELWQSCYDGKYDLLRMIALGAPIHDHGMLGAIKLAEVHKNMVLKKFEKYIVSYVLAGSLTQGKATASSDVDVWIVIDDTDVKKMTRVELKDKLRAIIIGMGVEAGEITGIKNKINIQVYILTDFWESLREANPVIFTLLRDGVSFYDRGIFMPWKQLLQMGRIKPSREAIDLFMSTGDQMLQRVKYKLKDMGMEDIYYAILTPSQAALMMYGLPPPTPRETPEMMMEIFVKKEKLLEEKFVKILERNIQIRKQIEHGEKKDLSGKDIDELLTDAEKYLARIQKLFKQIETMKEEKSVVDLYDRVVTVVRDVLTAEGVDSVKDTDIISSVDKVLASKGKVSAHALRDLKELFAAKKDYEAGKLTKPELEKARQAGEALITLFIEYMQRKRGIELEKAKIRVKYGNKFGDVVLLEKEAFIVHDIDSDSPIVTKAAILENGSLGETRESSPEELEKALASLRFPKKVFIHEPLFHRLKSLFGNDVEILMHV